jgi:hypothetical protein
MPRKIRSIAVVSLDFDSIARRDDKSVYRQMVATLRMSKKRMFPKSVSWNAYRVARTPRSITIHLLLSKTQAEKPKEVARFAFIPGPHFSA